MEHQDWKTLVIHPKVKKNETKKNIFIKSNLQKMNESEEEGKLSHAKMDSTFGKSLQKFRLNKSYTQKDLAQKLNIPAKDINEIENGKMKHNGQLMGKIKRFIHK
tara:strand:+ start:22 stop:336 length:315 start_codon:yes stop_codon:yes gene_type:complete